MGIDKENSRFFHHGVDMIRPNEGERFTSLRLSDGRVLVSEGPMILLTMEEAEVIDLTSKANAFPKGIIERTMAR